MKLFQIEEPEGSPRGSDGPGAAIGIALSPPAVAIAVGGNAELLPAAAGAPDLATGLQRGDGGWEVDALAVLLQALRGRAEKALARPVTHGVVALAAPDAAAGAALAAAAPAAGLVLLRVMDAAAAAALARHGGSDAAALGAAMAAEDDAAGLASRDA